VANRNFRIDRRGSSKIRVRSSWQGQTASTALRGAGWQGLVDTMEAVFEETQRQVPRLTNQLAESGRIVYDQSKGRASIVYGDSERRHGNRSPSQAYARRQHEDMTLKHPRGGKAKFVEDPMKESGALLERNLRRRIRDRLR
jgi:hypothetical protein